MSPVVGVDLSFAPKYTENNIFIYLDKIYEF